MAKTQEDLLHERIRRLENRVSEYKNNPAPTVPKYDLAAVPANNLLITVSEIGNAHSTTLSDTITMTTAFEDVRPTDMIWVMLMAPSRPDAGSVYNYPYDVQDSQGHAYYEQSFYNLHLEANPAGVNEGVGINFYATDPTSENIGMNIGNTITAYWSEPVYDRFIQAWLIRFEPFIPDSWPVGLVKTSDFNTAVYADSRVVLTVPNMGTISADNSLLFGIIAYATAPGRSIGYGGTSGYTGFYEASGTVKAFSSSRQAYTVHQQTHKANSYVVAGDVPVTYEIDQGTYNAGDSQPSFNGLGQGYSDFPALTPATNFWKGGEVFFITR